MPVTPPINLDPNSYPWGRWATDKIETIDAALARTTADQTNNNKQLNSSINVINRQLTAIAAQQDQIIAQQSQITAQQTQLANTVTYLSGLQVTAVTGNNFNSGPIPNDATDRWLTTPDSLSASLTVVVPTGRLLVTYGAAELSMEPQENTMAGRIGFDINGGEPAFPANVYATPNTRFGASVSRSTAVNVTPGSTVTVRTRCGTWTSGTSTIASINFARPWLAVQVIAAN